MISTGVAFTRTKKVSKRFSNHEKGRGVTPRSSVPIAGSVLRGRRLRQVKRVAHFFFPSFSNGPRRKKYDPIARPFRFRFRAPSRSGAENWSVRLHNRKTGKSWISAKRLHNDSTNASLRLSPSTYERTPSKSAVACTRQRTDLEEIPIGSSRSLPVTSKSFINYIQNYVFLLFLIITFATPRSWPVGSLIFIRTKF